jgi:hypothetical protein
VDRIAHQKSSSFLDVCIAIFITIINTNSSATSPDQTPVSVALVLFLKDKTGGFRPARRHPFARQQKDAKMPSPCGGHLLCQFSEKSSNNRF